MPVNVRSKSKTNWNKYKINKNERPWALMCWERSWAVALMSAHERSWALMSCDRSWALPAHERSWAVSAHGRSFLFILYLFQFVLLLLRTLTGIRYFVIIYVLFRYYICDVYTNTRHRMDSRTPISRPLFRDPPYFAVFAAQNVKTLCLSGHILASFWARDSSKKAFCSSWLALSNGMKYEGNTGRAVHVQGDWKLCTCTARRKNIFELGSRWIRVLRQKLYPGAKNLGNWRNFSFCKQLGSALSDSTITRWEP